MLEKSLKPNPPGPLRSSRFVLRITIPLVATPWNELVLASVMNPIRCVNVLVIMLKFAITIVIITAAREGTGDQCA